MYFLKGLLFPLYILVCSKLVLSTEKQEWNEFLRFQKKYDKFYDSLDQFEARFEIFRDNLQTILSHNLQNNYNFTLEINHFSDLTPEEFKNYYTYELFGDLVDGTKLTTILSYYAITLQKKKIFLSGYVYEIPLHKQPILHKFYTNQDLSVSERLANCVVSLPMHPYLDVETQDRIVAVVKENLPVTASIV